jgi:hypothetical protein
MDAAEAGRRPMTGSSRIVAHCLALDEERSDPRAPARARLETALGPELAGRLVQALAGGRRGRAQRS